MILARKVRGRGAHRLDQLLCDGGSAGDDAPVPNQLPGGARVRPPIHAVMSPEPAVLRRQRGVDQRLGYFRKGRANCWKGRSPSRVRRSGSPLRSSNSTAGGGGVNKAGGKGTKETRTGAISINSIVTPSPIRRSRLILFHRGCAPRFFIFPPGFASRSARNAADDTFPPLCPKAR